MLMEADVNHNLLRYFDPTVRERLRKMEYESVEHFLEVCSEVENQISRIHLPMGERVGVTQILKDMVNSSLTGVL